jgi:hypothetical protein
MFGRLAPVDSARIPVIALAAMMPFIKSRLELRNAR